ncbi:MAG: hypothetical protein AMXMBFR75_20710 [Candidatus Hinthialibacteria bacterium]|nr:class I SAM-dependent methyltransferase [bacterium]MBV6482374.1 hypothetical protein [bacterium]MCC6732226.1 class I SAM-dependent methyltransferase [Candidatus Omnitrophota bacterium]MCE7908489.1 class I SAM-dependent methyltransferase [Candidatus Omnitrophica bacterium COP1]MCK6496849.1 class I SAM-dependent methyltransferase [bacterium]
MSGERPRDIIRHFYDNFGWKKDARSGRSLGELAHEDLDPRTQAYMDANEERYCSLFQQPGRYFLDAASGGEPRTRFSGSFQYHVCADISILGLSEAREVLGERGLYVIADLAALPFREGVFDGAIASHCLYHVDKGQQPTVVQEMARVTRSGKNILIFYSHKRNLMTLLEKVCVEAGRLLRRNRPAAAGNEPPPIYFERVPIQTLTVGHSDVEVTCLRILSMPETQFLGKVHLLGFFIPIARWLENTFPRFSVHLGPYVAIRIRPE